MNGRKAISTIILALFCLVLMGPVVLGGSATEPCEATGGRVIDEPLDGLIVFLVTLTSAVDYTIRVCVLDSYDVKIHDHTERVSGSGTWEHRVSVPVATYRGATIVTVPNGGKVGGGHLADIRLCPTSNSMMLPSTVDDRPGIVVNTPACETVRSAGGQAPNQVDPGPPANPAALFFEGTSENLFRWELLSGSLALMGLVAFPRGRYFLLGLFTRVQGPAVLEQETRAEIYQLVRQDPGVNAHRIGLTLGLGSGATRYHLDVLRRNRLLSEVRRGALRCYFMAATASPQALRAMAVLRKESVERLYDAVLAKPNASLSNLAEAAGLSLSRASKALSQLVDAGLVERAQEGRMVCVKPTSLRPLQAAFESNVSSEVAAVS